MHPGFTKGQTHSFPTAATSLMAKCKGSAAFNLPPTGHPHRRRIRRRFHMYRLIVSNPFARAVRTFTGRGCAWALSSTGKHALVADQYPTFGSEPQLCM